MRANRNCVQPSSRGRTATQAINMAVRADGSRTENLTFLSLVFRQTSPNRPGFFYSDGKSIESVSIFDGRHGPGEPSIANLYSAWDEVIHFVRWASPTDASLRGQRRWAMPTLRWLTQRRAEYNANPENMAGQDLPTEIRTADHRKLRLLRWLRFLRRPPLNS